MPNWELQNCCQKDQVTFLVTIGVFSLVILALWRTVLLTPFKLITVFMHEASHAIACILTCGKVEGIQVHANEGGVTQTRGGIYWLILPAGSISASLKKVTQETLLFQLAKGPYSTIVETSNRTLSSMSKGCKSCSWILQAVGHIAEDQLKLLYFSAMFSQVCGSLEQGVDLGSSFWGMLLILASTNLLTARIAAGCLGLALLIVLFIAKNWTLRGLCIGFIAFLAIIWVLQEYTKVRILRYVILFIGVMNSLFSVYDIYDDLISRRVNSSDAEKFAELCPCPCTGVGWGMIWGMISFLFLCASIYLGLVILS